MGSLRLAEIEMLADRRPRAHQRHSLTIGIMNQVWKEQRVLGHGEMQTAKRQGRAVQAS